MAINVEKYIPGLLEDGFNTGLPIVAGHTNVAAVNSSATLTAAQMATGYITCKSTSAVTMTLATGTAFGTQLGATQGTTFELYIDNTASTSSGTVTVAVNTNAILSALAVANSSTSGLLTIPVGATGVACFGITFSSATAYTITRIA